MASFYPSSDSSGKARQWAQWVPTGAPTSSWQPRLPQAAAARLDAPAAPASAIEEGQQVSGTVTTISQRGIFLDIGQNRDALLPWSKCTLPEEKVRLSIEVQGLEVVSVDAASGKVMLRGPTAVQEPQGGNFRHGGAAPSAEATWNRNWEWVSWRNQSWQTSPVDMQARHHWGSHSWGDTAWQASDWRAWDAQPHLQGDTVVQEWPPWQTYAEPAAAAGPWLQEASQDHGYSHNWAQQWSTAGRPAEGANAAAPTSYAAAYETARKDIQEDATARQPEMPTSWQASCTAGQQHHWQQPNQPTQEERTESQPQQGEEVFDQERQGPRQQLELVATTEESTTSSSSRNAFVAEHRPAASVPTTVVQPLSREELKEAIFDLLDCDCDGHLGLLEMRPFVNETGFDGGDDEWFEEYRILCQDLHLDPDVGLSMKDFMELVDTDSDTGCYCSDEELEDQLKIFEGQRQKGELVKLRSSEQPEDPVAAEQSPEDKSETFDRDAMKRSLFRKLDADKDGRVGLVELRPFVEQTGFEGTDDDWKEEYRLLCKDISCDPSVGLSLKDFVQLLDDETDNGCYVPDEELQTILGKWEPASQEADPKPEPGGGSSSSSKAPPDPWGQQSDPWATAPAQRMHQQQLSREKKNKEKQAETWKEWEKITSTPALNMQKLLEASRVANAARKAKEAEAAAQAEAETAAQAEAEAAATASAKKAEEEEKVPADDEKVSTAYGSLGGAGHGGLRVPPAVEERDGHGLHRHARAEAPRRATSTAESLGQIRNAMVQVALGDRTAVKQLVDAVIGAPSVAHALAITSSAIKSLLQDKHTEAQVLLQADEIIVDFVDGVAALLSTLTQLARRLGVVSSPLLQRTLVAALARVDDKQEVVRSAAITATEEIMRSTDVYAFECHASALLAAMDPKRSPAMKIHGLRLLKLAWRAEGEKCVAHKLPIILPAAMALLSDVNSDVKAAASDAVETLCAFSGNQDLAPHHETVIGCARGNRDVAKCVREMAEVVFVQEVEAPALAVMMPVLTRGLKSRAARTQRQASVICENMCRLLPSVADVQHFTPQLLPLLKRISEDTADPEVRDVAARARCSLAQVADEDVTGNVRLDLRTAIAVAVSCAESIAETKLPEGEIFTPCPAPVRDVIMDFVVMLCVGMARCGVFRVTDWKARLLPHLLPLVGHSQAEKLVPELQTIARRLETKEMRKRAAQRADDEEDASRAVLCDCNMMLARGAATLIKSTQLRLLRGCIYGLVGGNDSGKSCLLRAIHDRRVAGFPSVRELSSALVEHGVGERAPENAMTPLEYLSKDTAIRGKGFDEDKIKAALHELGFAEGDKISRPIKSLSGGWRMKLGLARAMLQDADLLLLDEPTGHLDADNALWLVEYLQRLRDNGLEQGVTVITVSHDTTFLDQVCTHIIHVQNQTLETHRGNFSKFIDNVPDAQLGTATVQEQPISAFQLPEPGALEGVKSQGRRLFNMQAATFTYEGSKLPAVKNVTAELSLKSRVAIVGPNGAGKSTLAGLIVGELAVDAGTCWRHPNLRVAFVAQHAFHHLEKHVDLSATEYILWRFQGNEDREALEARADEAEQDDVRTYRLDDDSLVVCDEDDPRAVEPEVILGRRQRGRLGFEYEVRWRDQGGKVTWVLRSQLARMGHLGLAKREDERQAAQRALATRPLTTPAVEAHLAGFGLSPEEATHRRIAALSNGQMARTVLAAATWLAPHLLVLDEPTNYLDGPSLAALGAGLRTFGGGVVVISHNPVLLNEVCTERWMMEKGTLHLEGSAPRETGGEETTGGGSRKLAEAREKKRLKRIKELRRKNGEEVGEDEEDWWSDLLKKANSKTTKKK